MTASNVGLGRRSTFVAVSPALGLSLVAFFSHTEPFSNSAAAAATPTRHLNHAILSSHSVYTDTITQADTSFCR